MRLPSTPPIAVLDCSVLFPRWSRLVLQRIAVRSHPPFIPAWSEWIIAETWRTLAWHWLNRAAHPDEFEWDRLTLAGNGMLRQLLPVMRLVSVRDYAGPTPWPQLTDVDDAPVWQTAVVAGAQYVVSQNTRHFPPLVHGNHRYGGVEYLTAIEFVEDVLGESAARVLTEPLPAGAAVRSRRAP